MTVAELKKVLDECDDDMDVMVDMYEYGGYNIDYADAEIVYPKNDKPFLRVY